MDNSKPTFPKDSYNLNDLPTEGVAGPDSGHLPASQFSGDATREGVEPTEAGTAPAGLRDRYGDFGEPGKYNLNNTLGDNSDSGDTSNPNPGRTGAREEVEPSGQTSMPRGTSGSFSVDDNVGGDRNYESTLEEAGDANSPASAERGEQEGME